VLSLPPGTAVSADCGDDVGGHRVACSCGDSVVSDTRLLPSDPVVGQRCPLDGLILAASSAAEEIRLDLGGLAIVGAGAGTGLRVRYGGCDGAVIRGGSDDNHGQIVGFGTGLSAHDPDAVRRIENLEVIGNRRDGIALRTAGALLFDVAANDNGGNGLRVSGEGGRMVRVEASGNRAAGMRLYTRGLIVEGKAANNRRHGVLSHGVHNDLRHVTAVNNGGHGVVAAGFQNQTDGIVAQGNALENVAFGLGGVRP
jgi:hypothetical protein